MERASKPRRDRGRRPQQLRQALPGAVRICKDAMHSRALSSDIRGLTKGLMVESCPEDGCQKPGEGVYGKSITDACLGWEKSKELIYRLAEY